MVSRRHRLVRSLGLSLLVASIVGLAFGPQALATAASLLTRDGVTEVAQTGAQLQNPGFDNNLWYEFNDRYGTWLSGSWLPDGDFPNSPQDWRLWYMRGTSILQSFPEQAIVHAGVESVALRTYPDGTVHEGGLYQVIYNVTPCLVYEFSMHALSRPDAHLPNQSAQLRVGIDPTGWHPNPAVDPAMPGYYPDSIVWSAPQDIKYPNFGRLDVRAEAQSGTVSAFTRALAYGGDRHAIVWDTGGLAEVTTRLHDPAALPAPTFTASATPQPGGAQIAWSTPTNAVSQVYYRLLPATVSPPDQPYSVYLPMVVGGGEVPADWMISSINTMPSTSHIVVLSGLQAGRSYEFIAVSRGLSGAACATWVSAPQTFTVP